MATDKNFIVKNGLDVGGNVSANSRYTFDYNNHYLEAGTNSVAVKNGSGTSLLLVNNTGVTVAGDLTVNGTTTTLNTATLDVEDKNITLNKGSGDTSGSANGAGITIQDAVDASTDATILWNASGDRFTVSHALRVNENGAGGYYSTIDRGNSTPGSTSPWLGLFNNADISSATYGWAFYDSSSDGSLQLWNRNNSTTGYDVMTFKRGGNVGIDQTNPTFKLDVTGTLRTTADAYFQNDVYIGSKLRHNGDVDNYIGFAAADTQSFVTGNSTRLQITNTLVRLNQENNNQDFAVYSSNSDYALFVDASTDRVGIKTNTPAADLHIENSSGATLFMGDTNGRNLRFRTANSGSQNTNISSYAGLYLGGADNQNHMVIDGNGKVGIGTVAPSAPLHINSDTEHQIKIQASASAGASQQLISGGGYAYTVYQNATGGNWRIGAYGGSSFIIRDQGNSGNRIEIGSTGMVGIGTSPSVDLDILRTNARIKLRNSSDQLNIGLWDGSNHRIEGDANRPLFITSYHNDGIRLGKSGTPKVYIDSSGLGIDINPSAPLHVAKNDATTNSIQTLLQLSSYSTGTTTTGFGPGILMQAERNNGVLQSTGFINSVAEINSGSNISSGLAFGVGEVGVVTEQVRIRRDGNVGIANTDPLSKLHIGTSTSVGNQTYPAIMIGASGGNYRLGLYTDSEAAIYENKNGDDGHIFKVKTAGEAMRIDGGSGSVIISSSNLYLTGNVDRRIKLSDSGVAGVSDSDNTVHIRANDDDLILSAAGNGKILFRENGDEHLSIDQNGYATFKHGGNDFGIQIRSEGTSRSGLVIDKPATSTIMGSALVLADESYRLGTASYYHVRMMQNGDTYFGNSSGTRFISDGDLRIADAGITAGQDRPLFSGANAGSYSTSTNLAYTKSTDPYPVAGEALKARVRARAYTKYVHMKTNLTSENVMFFFRIFGYMYNYGVNECVRGGYTYQGGVIAESVQNAYNANASYTIGDFYRSSSGGFLCIRLDVHQTGYTEGEAIVMFGSHSSTITRELQITDMQHRDDGNNAY